MRRWDAGEGRGLDRSVAVLAANPQSGDMMFVAELHRLFDRYIYFRIEGGAEENSKRPGEASDEKN